MKTYCKGIEFTRKSVVEALHRWKKSDSGKENGWRVADEYGAESIDFAGYRIWCARGRRVDLRKRLWKRLRRAFARYMRRRTERLARRVCSYWGWLKTAVMEHQMNVKRCIFNAARAVG